MDAERQIGNSPERAFIERLLPSFDDKSDHEVFEIITREGAPQIVSTIIGGSRWQPLGYYMSSFGVLRSIEQRSDSMQFSVGNMTKDDVMRLVIEGTGDRLLSPKAVEYLRFANFKEDASVRPSVNLPQATGWFSGKIQALLSLLGGGGNETPKGPNPYDPPKS